MVVAKQRVQRKQQAPKCQGASIAKFHSRAKMLWKFTPQRNTIKRRFYVQPTGLKTEWSSLSTKRRLTHIRTKRWIRRRLGGLALLLLLVSSRVFILSTQVFLFDWLNLYSSCSYFVMTPHSFMLGLFNLFYLIDE